MENITVSNRKVKVDDMTLYFNVLKVEPKWEHVWLLGQVLFVEQTLMWSVGKPISLIVVAVSVTWIISAINKY